MVPPASKTRKKLNVEGGWAEHQVSTRFALVHVIDGRSISTLVSTCYGKWHLLRMKRPLLVPLERPLSLSRSFLRTGLPPPLPAILILHTFGRPTALDALGSVLRVSSSLRHSSRSPLVFPRTGSRWSHACSCQW